MTRRWRCGAARKHLKFWAVDTRNEFLSPDERSHSVLQKTRRVMLSGENLFKHLFKANHLSQIMLKIKKPERIWHSFEASITGFDTFLFLNDYRYEVALTVSIPIRQWRTKETHFLTIKSAKDFKILHKRLAFFSLDCFHLIIQESHDWKNLFRHIQQNWRETVHLLLLQTP